MKTCEVCERIDKIKNAENDFFVMELQTGYVVFGDFQRFPGYTVFLCKEHVKEVYHLDNTMRMQHLFEMSIVAEAVEKVFAADKMNYESLGNGIAHLHWHLYPRRQGDMPFPGPVWWLGKEALYDEAYKTTASFIQTYKPKLQLAIEQLLAATKKGASI